MSFFAAIWGWVTWLFSALLPFASRSVFSPVTRWIIWLILDVAFLGLLYWLKSFG